MTNKEIENFINTYRTYPTEYIGKKDSKLLSTLNGYYRYDTKTNTITRGEVKIDENGDVVIIGRFTFPIDRPEEKVEALPYDPKYAIETYNKLMRDLGYEYNEINDLNEDTKDWNLRDLVSEVEYVRSTFYEDGHANALIRDEDPKTFNKLTNRLRHYIRTYKDYIGDMKVHVKHCSKYDN